MIDVVRGFKPIRNWPSSAGRLRSCLDRSFPSRSESCDIKLLPAAFPINLYANCHFLVRNWRVTLAEQTSCVGAAGAIRQQLSTSSAYARAYIIAGVSDTFVAGRK